MGVVRVLLTLREKLLNLCGYRIWPQNRDPMIKGPQPRVLSSEAKAALKRAHCETDLVNSISIKQVDSEMEV